MKFIQISKCFNRKVKYETVLFFIFLCNNKSYFVRQLSINNMVNRTLKIVAVTLMILSGAFDTIVFKTQNSQSVTQGGVTRYFFHPYMQVAAIFLGQALALLIYFIYRKINTEVFEEKEKQAIAEGKSIEFNKFLLAIPALCDCMASNMQLISLNFIAGSVYQMMRGGTIVTTFIFSILILKIRVKKHQIAGSVLAFLGVAIVGISAVAFSTQSASSSFSNARNLTASTGAQIAGYFMLIASLFFNGFQFVFQQTLFNKYHIEPLQMVGFQGIFGLIYCTIIISIISFIPCSFGADACVLNADGESFLENASSYFNSVGNDGFLLAFVILGVFSILTFNTSGVSVTKYINALARSICDVSRTILIWIVGIIVTVTIGQTQDIYKWQSLITGRIIVQLVGFIILIAGNLVYNNLIKLNFLEANQEENGGLLQNGQNENQPVTSRSTY